MDFVGLGHDPLAVLVVAALLGHLADVDFGIEVGGESHAVVTGVAVHDVEVVDLVEVVLGRIGGEDRRHARIEAAAEDGRKSLGLEAVLVGPLPRILEVRLVLGLVIGRVEVVHAAFEAGVHDGEVLVGEGYIDHDVGTERAEQRAQVGHVVGIDLGGFHAAAADGRVNGIAFRFGAAREHDVRENGIGGDLLRHHRTDASGADDQGFHNMVFCLGIIKFILIRNKNSFLFW